MWLNGCLIINILRTPANANHSTWNVAECLGFSEIGCKGTAFFLNIHYFFRKILHSPRIFPFFCLFSWHFPLQKRPSPPPAALRLKIREKRAFSTITWHSAVSTIPPDIAGLRPKIKCHLFSNKRHLFENKCHLLKIPQHPFSKKRHQKLPKGCTNAPVLCKNVESPGFQCRRCRPQKCRKRPDDFPEHPFSTAENPRQNLDNCFWERLFQMVEREQVI